MFPLYFPGNTGSQKKDISTNFEILPYNLILIFNIYLKCYNFTIGWQYCLLFSLQYSYKHFTTEEKMMWPKN